ADPRDDASDACLELLLAGDAAAAAREHVDAVLEPHAIVRERVVPLAVIVLETREVVVRSLDELGARHALAFRDRLPEHGVRRAHGLDPFPRGREIAPAAVDARGPNRQLLDLGDAAVTNPQPKSQCDQLAVLRARAVLLD